jgi:hypothetical protein
MYAADYAPAIRCCAGWQLATGLVASLVLDQGQTARAFGVTLICHWAIILLILHRRPAAPTPWDLAIIRYGIFPLFILVMGLGPWFLRIIGTPSHVIP